MFSFLLGKFLELKSLGHRIFIFSVSLKKKQQLPGICQGMCHDILSQQRTRIQNLHCLGSSNFQNMPPKLLLSGESRNPALLLPFPSSPNPLPSFPFPSTCFVHLLPRSRRAVFSFAMSSLSCLQQSGANQEIDTTQ